MSYDEKMVFLKTLAKHYCGIAGLHMGSEWAKQDDPPLEYLKLATPTVFDGHPDAKSVQVSIAFQRVEVEEMTVERLADVFSVRWLQAIGAIWSLYDKLSGNQKHNHDLFLRVIAEEKKAGAA